MTQFLSERSLERIKKKIIGTNARKLSAREVAIFRYVWGLNKTEIKLLNICFTREVTAEQLAEMLEVGAGKLLLDRTAYYVIFEAGMERLAVNSRIYLNFRSNFPTKLHVALVRIVNHG